MCPACMASMATVALAAASATSAGGVTAFVVRKLRSKSATKVADAIQTGGKQDGTDNRFTK